jgi:hypothetical protein
MEQETPSVLEDRAYIVAQARLDARCDFRTSGRLMYSIYANLRELNKLNAEDWRAYQDAYAAEQTRLTVQ